MAEEIKSVPLTEDQVSRFERALKAERRCGNVIAAALMQIAQESIKTERKAWNRAAVLLGYKDATEVQNAGYAMVVDYIGRRIVLHKEEDAGE